jgi:hypothetical protein
MGAFNASFVVGLSAVTAYTATYSGGIDDDDPSRERGIRRGVTRAME